ncbi:pathogenecity determinant protein [Leucas zeylanica yellow vein betasatellite]|uniref:Pathogenecity determinant protein n=1 Tax=Leucas zeylanica yellow vein betasatellite TaxID=2845505 RepID=C9DRK0_9VIRU|nr:pathogenecity determinant protein [Leucas zeylanica yellow vein virus satellite DNA beta]ACV53152.1 pathogenecity determinant protein [Leucas zeylanica yellow vein virus satellite DNA beta]
MTIKYNNKKGMEFIIDVKLKEDDSIIVQVKLFSTKSPTLARQKFNIPYDHSGFIPPFDFNSLEEGIKEIIQHMYEESTIKDFKQENIVEAIDILMMHEAPVIDINLDRGYDVYGSVSV